MTTTVYSNTTGKTYNIKDTVRILNCQQVAAYMCNGAEPLDIYASRHYETGNPVLVFLFDRNATKDLYDKWCKHELR